MQKLIYTITINAPKEKVRNTLINDTTYRQWTEIFGQGSHFVGSRDQGSKILFLAPGENGTTGGMTSMIAENRPYEFISIKHLGEVANDVEDTTSDRIKSLYPAFENYTLTEHDGKTELLVELENNYDQQLKDWMNEMFPKALQKLKEIAEVM